MNLNRLVLPAGESGFAENPDVPGGVRKVSSQLSGPVHCLKTQRTGMLVEREGASYYCIENIQLLPEFMMSLTSASDYWMFVSSYGALTAGRKDPDGALFPYYSADKLLDMRHVTGPLSIFRIESSEGLSNWAPFAESCEPSSAIRRNLYKNPLGNRLIFEEINSDLGLAFEYQWTLSAKFGLVRNCRLRNFGVQDCALELLDGLQNILPPALDHHFQLRFSNLVDAYKRTEQLPLTGLGLFYLNSIPTDRAEPSEGLRANVVWQSGLEASQILLSTRQLSAFRAGKPVVSEHDVRGQRGAYLVASRLQLASGATIAWDVVACVDLDQTDVINLNQLIVSGPPAMEAVRFDLAEGEAKLTAMISAADGKQIGGDLLRCNRHQSNVLFNIMRGGIPVDGYALDKVDFLRHVKIFNAGVFANRQDFLTALPDDLCLDELLNHLKQLDDPDLLRLGLDYLPLTFSRRHGDPTRPWNLFSISTLRADGSENLDYQGNWRDIFQNWEALALAYPRFVENMVFRFLNASTVDGYNPYRITKDGFEWEAPDPADPWANIGYWGDHQVIYLLKLLEWSHDFTPLRLNQWLNVPVCTYAQVPYRIRSYEEMIQNPQSTIDFDFELAARIDERVANCGTDGKLLRNKRDELCRVTLIEKLLVPILAKMTNFVPGGGIWLNTQRPEWNDANNALVGKGLSVVTVCHLRRYFEFLANWFRSSELDSITMSREVIALMTEIGQVLTNHSEQLIGDALTNENRRWIVDQLSQAGSRFRRMIYDSGLSGETSSLPMFKCIEFLEHCLAAMDQTIQMNRRADGLYHAYNLLDWSPAGNESRPSLAVQHLYKMLEGQVAVLSSGVLSPVEALTVLDALRASALYRADQNSYLLYPDRELPTFLTKNQLPIEMIQSSQLLQQLLSDQDDSLIRKDVNGNFHFPGQLRNAADVTARLELLAQQPRYADLVAQETGLVRRLYEQVFDHQSFTGRSGTFFGYEGLGSIYWHMVSKLALAINENVLAAQASSAAPEIVERLVAHYQRVRDGIALDKSPSEYGAFPTDPYSHTPRHAGAQQPGMTGQVKEDILSRFSELGIRIQAGVLSFDPFLFEAREWTHQATELKFTNRSGQSVRLPVEAGSFAFTFCQTPIVYHQADSQWIRILTDQGTSERSGTQLTAEETSRLFDRDGSLLKIEVGFPPVEARIFNHQLAKHNHIRQLNQNLSGEHDDQTAP